MAALGDDALGLLDDDAAVEGGLELFGKGFALVNGAGLEKSDGGHVGEGLPELDGVGVKRAGPGAEQVERADDVGAQPHGQGVDGGESDLAGLRGEARPAARGRGQVGDGDGPAGMEALGAGALVGLELEQLQQPGLFGGGGHQSQGVPLIGQQQPGRGDVEKADTPGGQQVQELE